MKITLHKNTIFDLHCCLVLDTMLKNSYYVNYHGALLFTNGQNLDWTKS